MSLVRTCSCIRYESPIFTIHTAEQQTLHEPPYWAPVQGIILSAVVAIFGRTLLYPRICPPQPDGMKLTSQHNPNEPSPTCRWYTNHVIDTYIHSHHDMQVYCDQQPASASPPAAAPGAPLGVGHGAAPDDLDGDAFTRTIQYNHMQH